MCFSAEASLATLVFGLVGSAGIYRLGSAYDHILALYLGYISLMQGIEWVLWKNQTCDYFHKNVSILGMLLNTSQPLVLGALVLALSTRTENFLYIGIIMALYTLYTVIYLQQYKSNLQCTTARPNDPHLVWNWLLLPYYYWSWFAYIAAVCAIAILGMPTLFEGVAFASLAVVSMGLSIAFYPRHTMGSIWCFFSAACIPILYIYRVLKN